MNIPRSAIAQMERIEKDNDRYGDWFEMAVEEIADALKARGDVADAINTAWLADDEYGVEIDYSDIAEAVLVAARRVEDSERKAA